MLSTNFARPFLCGEEGVLYMKKKMQSTLGTMLEQSQRQALQSCVCCPDFLYSLYQSVSVCPSNHGDRASHV